MSATLAPDPPRQGADESVVSARRLGRAFDGRTVLDRVDLEIARGEIVALIGRSGSGKSTLLRALAGLDAGTTGEYEVRGTVTMAFQDARLLPWKPTGENVILGFRAAPDERRGRALQMLGEVGLAERFDAWPLTLSGGEAQRASLARALIREPDLLLLDEPFGALDALTRIAMHDLVLELWSRYRPAILLVTHDVDEALALADRVLVLADGRIAHQELVGVARPRAREHPDLIQQRERLLADLGINPKGTTQ
jgi:sulfonate transport system ATP-binding protein